MKEIDFYNKYVKHLDDHQSKVIKVKVTPEEMAEIRKWNNGQHIIFGLKPSIVVYV